MIKPPLHYWFCRLYVLVLWPLMAATFLYAFHEAATGHGPRVLFYVFAWVPALFPMVCWMLSVGAFGFDFSAFGKYCRSPVPNEPPVAVFKQSGVILGNRMRAPGTLTVYQSGLAMRLYFVGTVFLPIADIEALEPIRWWTIIHHHCPEVRTPITLPNNVADVVKGAHKGDAG